MWRQSPQRRTMTCCRPRTEAENRGLAAPVAVPSLQVRQQVGDNVTKDQLKDFVWATLKSGKVGSPGGDGAAWARGISEQGGVVRLSLAGTCLALRTLHVATYSIHLSGNPHPTTTATTSCRWCPALVMPCCARPIHATPARWAREGSRHPDHSRDMLPSLAQAVTGRFKAAELASCLPAPPPAARLCPEAHARLPALQAHLPAV